MKDQNLFKAKLYQHTMPVPEDLWGKIEANLPANKKRFPFFWFSTVAGVVGVSALILLLASQNGMQEKTPAPETPTTETPVEATAVNFKNSSSNNQSFTDQSTETSSVNNTEISSNSGKENNKKESQYSKNSLHNTNTLTPKNRSTINSDFSNSTSTENAEISKNAETDIANFSRINHATEGLSLTDVDFVSVRTGEADAIDNIKPDPNCYKFTGDNGVSRLSVDFFGGPGFAPRTFQDTGGETPQYVEARELTEHAQYAFSVGARVNYYLNRGFAIRAGLMYEQIGDLFDYKDSLSFQISTKTDSFFSADGTFLYAETNTVLTYGTTIKKIHNRYHHVDVPLLASYELPLGRYTLMINAGPVLNLTTSFRGQILDPGLAPKHITPGERNAISVYKTNLGLSIYLGAGALIPLNDNMTALIEPRFLYRIKPVTLESYALEEKRHFAGLNLGIRYHFN